MSEATSAAAPVAREVGPALGMKYRDEVLRYAASHRENPGWDGIVALSASELAELIGPARSVNEALDLAFERAVKLTEERLASA